LSKKLAASHGNVYPIGRCISKNRIFDVEFILDVTGFENGLLMKMVVAKDGLEGKSTGCGEVTGKQSTCGSLCG
jgi:hypothetical protein